MSVLFPAQGSKQTLLDGSLLILNGNLNTNGYDIDLVTPTELSRVHDVTSSIVGVNDVQTLTNKTLTSPVIDDGDTGVSVVSSDQTHASAIATIPDIGDAADVFAMVDTAQTFTNKTISSDDNTITIDGGTL